MAPALIRDSFLGQLIRVLSRKRLLRYPEEDPNFTLPERYAPHKAAGSPRTSFAQNRQSDAGTLVDAARASTAEKQSKPSTPHASSPGAPPRRTLTGTVEDGTFNSRHTSAATTPVGESPAEKTNVVDWYGPDDPENPMNWSFGKKCFATFDICLITFAIYIGSAIYSPGTQEISQKFGISEVAATLGLTMFVAGYAIGPMFLAPLSEIPQLGRTSVYIITLSLFVVLQVPTALAKDLGALLPLRFLAGFVGSPPLATGGASLTDIWAPEDRVVAIALWGMAAVGGPVLGPLIGGFAVQNENWTWSIWILLWISGAALAFLIVFMPETSSQALLYRRAVRLRKLTGNSDLKSQGEIDSGNFTLKDVGMMTMVRPFVLGFTEPIVACFNLYIALVYGILYIFIESFAVVFIQIYHFNLGENGLAFLGIFFGALFTMAIFIPYARRVVKPMFAPENIKNYVPENRLPPAMLGSFALPIALFWFGWSSRASVHWIVPIIGSAFFSVGTFLLFQSGLNYLADCYPKYVASVLAGNDLFRSLVGAAFPLFSTAFFKNLGVGPACSLLGGISILMIPIPFVLYRYGARIRKLSKYAEY